MKIKTILSEVLIIIITNRHFCITMDISRGTFSYTSGYCLRKYSCQPYQISRYTLQQLQLCQKRTYRRIWRSQYAPNTNRPDIQTWCLLHAVVAPVSWPEEEPGGAAATLYSNYTHNQLTAPSFSRTKLRSHENYYEASRINGSSLEQHAWYHSLWKLFSFSQLSFPQQFKNCCRSVDSRRH
jgi:hypothetical protein